MLKILPHYGELTLYSNVIILYRQPVIALAHSETHLSTPNPLEHPKVVKTSNLRQGIAVACHLYTEDLCKGVSTTFLSSISL